MRAQILTHITHTLCYGALVLSETLQSSATHLVKLGSYSLLAILAALALSHLTFSYLVHKK